MKPKVLTFIGCQKKTCECLHCCKETVGTACAYTGCLKARVCFQDNPYPCYDELRIYDKVC